jgi:hypothetical protein
MARWEDWKKFVSEILASYRRDNVDLHFRRAELRLLSLNTIHCFTQLPPFDLYFHGWRNYGGFFHDNLTYR